MKPTRKKYLLYGSLIVVGGILAFILIETVRAKNTGFETKTLWDWMELLIIPFALAVGAFYLEHSERSVERGAADERARLALKVAGDNQQEAALQAYLDRMAELLLKEKLRTTKNKEVRNVARIRTLTVLRGLDGRRKGMVILFLKESGLIDQKPVINLNGADLRWAFLMRAGLSDTDLGGTDLGEADLSEAVLIGARLVGASLVGASLARVNLSNAQLLGARLTNADLGGAHLLGTDLRMTNLSGANLRAAILHPSWLESAFGQEFLQQREKEGLERSTEANLWRANLSGADLRGAIVSETQLAAAGILKGAIMPDGTKHD